MKMDTKVFIKYSCISLNTQVFIVTMDTKVFIKYSCI